MDKKKKRIKDLPREELLEHNRNIVKRNIEVMKKCNPSLYEQRLQHHRDKAREYARTHREQMAIYNRRYNQKLRERKKRIQEKEEAWYLTIAHLPLFLLSQADKRKRSRVLRRLKYRDLKENNPEKYEQHLLKVRQYRIQKQDDQRRNS